MDKFCSKCGAPLAHGAIFCTSCGAKLGTNADPESTISSEPRTQLTSSAEDNFQTNKISLLDQYPVFEEEDKTLESGETIVLLTITGEVVSTQETQTTRIHQGTRMNAQGHIVPGRISSSVDSALKLWVRTSEGSEVDVNLNNVDFSVREGHVLRVTEAGSVGTSSTNLVRIENVTTGEKAYFPPTVETIGNKAVWNFSGLNRFKDFLIAHLITVLIIIYIGLSMGGHIGELLLGVSIVGVIPSFFVYIVATLFNLLPAVRRRRRLSAEISQIVWYG